MKQLNYGHFFPGLLAKWPFEVCLRRGNTPHRAEGPGPPRLFGVGSPRGQALFVFFLGACIKSVQKFSAAPAIFFQGPKIKKEA